MKTNKRKSKKKKPTSQTGQDSRDGDIDREAEAFAACAKALIRIRTFEGRRLVMAFVADYFAIDPTKLNSRF